MSATEIKKAVRERYAEAAAEASDGCCGLVETNPVFGADLYEALDAEGLPDAARLASLGCGNTTAVAELREGEPVLDLGSGGGIDVLLSARRVGPSGKAYGLDMTPEMLDLARRNAVEAGAENVEFLEGDIEAIPLPDASVDVIISNCVINLSADKPSVFREAHRVLVQGGRFAVSDVIAKRSLTEEETADMASWTGCIAGALTEDDYRDGLTKAGFKDVTVDVTHEVAPQAVSAIIRATA